MNMRDYPTLHLETVNEHERLSNITLRDCKYNMRDYPTLHLETVNEHERLSNITLRDCK